MENVLIVETDILQEYLNEGAYSLLVSRKDEILSAVLANYQFQPRDEMEKSTAYRQIIPYCILRHNDNILVFERLKGQSEKRLHTKLSVGAGGHINLSDNAEPPFETIVNGIKRELSEEILVDFDANNDLNYVGVINDESCEVSRSHLGLLIEIHLNSNNYRVIEVDKMNASWFSLHELSTVRNELEDWSKIVFDQYLNANM